MVSSKSIEEFMVFSCIILVMFFVALGVVTLGYAQGRCQGVTKSQGVLEISFEYARQKTIASNQFALWIEDAEGNLVKTIYVTKFTGGGGYVKRPDCLPVWVKKADPSSWSVEMVDTVATATPQSGSQTYIWEGRDENGNFVAPGEYRFFLEATLYWSSRVLYSATFHYGGESQEEIPLSVRYFGEDIPREMIQNLRLRYTASK